MTYDPPDAVVPALWPGRATVHLPEGARGQVINAQRRELNAAIEAFEAKHGRKPTKKELKRLRG